jgi:hypothetical protein
MDHGKAVRILSALAQGTDPTSGDTLAADAAWQQPDVVRALFFALSHLGLPVPADVRPPPDGSRAEDRTRTPAGNRGRPWSQAETDRVAADFDAGQPIDTIAAATGRSKLAVEIRLARLGRLPMPANTRYGPPKSASPVDPVVAATHSTTAATASDTPVTASPPPSRAPRAPRARRAEQPAPVWSLPKPALSPRSGTGSRPIAR